jgi:alkylated DNA repair protein (DNA oxidative demethylase)
MSFTSMKTTKKNRSLSITKDGLFYRPLFINKRDREDILNWLKGLSPLWEMRFSKTNPPPEGDQQRQLLRPVYWLGNWQFACLNYYHPPKGTMNRCIIAENYPPVLKKQIKIIEQISRTHFKKGDVPEKWKLNTCLINFYGTSVNKDGKKIDCARVGDHKDFEPGPVASLSFGERAFFQFVLGNKNLKNNVLEELWLDDSSLQIFAGSLYKDRAFHRVQRVENKYKYRFDLNVENFETRRINFTFRYVPDEHLIHFRDLPENLKDDILPYIRTLSISSEHFRKELL